MSNSRKVRFVIELNAPRQLPKSELKEYLQDCILGGRDDLVSFSSRIHDMEPSDFRILDYQRVFSAIIRRVCQRITDIEATQTKVINSFREWR
jgi:hypothetical protein